MKKFVCVAMSGVLAASFAVSASAADQIKVGGIGPTTGPAAIYGTAAMYGEQIAVDEVNKAGGAVQFDWKFEDDTHDAETAVGAEAVNDNMFMMTPSASSQDVIDTGDNVFQICFTDPNQGTASADYISSKKLGTKIGVIYNSSDAYSSGINTNFQAEASKVGLQVVANEAFTDDNSTDLTTQVQACKDAGADLVFLPIYYTPASQILKAANDMGYKPKFFGCDGLDGILGVEGFDTSLAEGVMLLTPFVATSADKATQDFVAKYKEVSKGDTPNQFAADAYDVIKVLAKAGEKAGIERFRYLRCTQGDDHGSELHL